MSQHRFKSTRDSRRQSVSVRELDRAVKGILAGPVSASSSKQEQDEHCQSYNNDLQQDTGVNMSDLTVRNRLCESGLRTECPLVGPVITSWFYGARLAYTRAYQNWQVHHWHPVLFTEESRLTLTTRDRREKVRRGWGEHCVTCDII